MGNPTDLVIYYGGQRNVVGRAFFDPALGEIKALVDDKTPQYLKDLIWGVNKNEFSIVPKAPVMSTFDQLMTTTTTTVVTDVEEI